VIGRTTPAQPRMRFVMDQSISIPTTMNMQMPPMFDCERRNLRLTVSGCSKLWISANGKVPPAPHEGKFTCIGCPVGRLHATGQAQNPIVETAAALARHCSRCGRASDRIINRLERGLCLSCDARHGEAMRGRNAKGHRPALSDQLHTETVLMTSAGVTTEIVRHHALSLSELIFHTRKFLTAPATFTIDAMVALHAAGGFEADDRAIHVIHTLAPAQIEQRHRAADVARRDAARTIGHAGGRPRADRENPYNGRFPAGYGNAKSYLLRRVARQSPEVLAAWESGEHRSVRQAAQAAGIIRAA
jgi:hypothetical protein